MNTLRLFFAIEIGATAQAQIHERLQAVLSHLRPSQLREVRWTAACNLHITLKFLGETSEDRVATILDAVSPIFSIHSPARGWITRCGVFDRQKARLQRPAPSVVRLEIEEGGYLSALAGELDAALEMLGYERERRAYVPHVTLARIHTQEVIDFVLERFADGSLDLPFAIETVTLFESELRKGGPVYTPVWRWRLGTSGKGGVVEPAVFD